MLLTWKKSVTMGMEVPLLVALKSLKEVGLALTLRNASTVATGWCESIQTDGSASVKSIVRKAHLCLRIVGKEFFATRPARIRHRIEAPCHRQSPERS